MKMNVECKIIDPRIGEQEGFEMPTYATPGAAAMDLRACVEKEVTLQPGENQLIGSGIAVHIKDPSVGLFLLPRSGLGNKLRICLANGVGLIDSDYSGEVKISLFNNGSEAFTVTPGMRVCQAVFLPVVQASLNVVSEFSGDSERGAQGFGSTGT